MFVDHNFFYIIFSVHEVKGPTNPVVYFHFEEDQGWTNHRAQFVMEDTPFAPVSMCTQTAVEVPAEVFALAPNEPPG